MVSFSDLTDLHRLRERDKTFMRMVSHDIRLPLTVIQGHAELLRTGFGQANEKELATSTDAIFAAIRKAERIIDDLAELTLLEQGRVKLDRQRLSPAAVIHQLLLDNEQVLDRQRLVVEIPEQLPPICADYRRFERIIINLVTNALKFSPVEKKVRIRAERDGSEVVIAVSDQGRGIEKRDLPRLFDPYYRSKATETTSGSGLGLYIARLLTTAHGGRVWAESELGAGSTFYVAVPMECH